MTVRTKVTPLRSPHFSIITSHANRKSTPSSTTLPRNSTIYGKHYHPIGANVSVSALVDFASACYLETMTEGMKISPAAAHYPDYVRLKSGVADFYAFGIWPAAQFPDITVYVQASASNFSLC
jgi:hypothetical protein